MICVGAPAYFEAAGTPDTPHALDGHACINLHLPNHGGLHAWEFDDAEGTEIRVKVKGQVCFNTIVPVLQAAKDGADRAA